MSGENVGARRKLHDARMISVQSGVAYSGFFRIQLG